MESNKRQMNTGISLYSTQDYDPDLAKLSTIGMRIRKAVQDGYSVKNSYQYDRNYLQQQYQQFDRSPLPNGMDQPPSLSNSGSTFQSNGSSYDWNTSNLVTLEQPCNKRKYEEELPNLDDYRNKYGDLKFNEEF